MLSKEDQLHRLQVITHLNWLAKQILLSFFAELKALDLASYLEQVKSVDWTKNHDIYTKEFPPFALKQFEYLQDRLRLEIDTEGDIVSPEWYLCQLALLPIAETLDAQLNELMILGRTFYVEWPASLADAGWHRAAIMTTLDGIEYFKKLKIDAPALYDRMEIVEQHRVLKEIAFPKIDKATVETEIGENERQLHLNLAGFVDFFAREDNERLDELPDLLGNVVTVLANSYFQGLVKNDVELCTQVFRAYLFGNSLVWQSLAEKVSRLPSIAIPAHLSEPTAEAFALSGLAFLLSEYHQAPALWKSCVEVWQTLLGRSDSRATVAAQYQLFENAKKFPLLTGRSLVRENWTQEFDGLVKHLTFRSLERDGDPVRTRTQVAGHPSLCIRALVRSDMPFSLFRPEEIFLDVFLSDALELDRSDVWRVHDVKNAMERQRELEDDYGFVYESSDESIDED